MTRPFSHYFKACPYEAIDLYRVFLLFGQADPCLQHAIKKAMFAGLRGTKSAEEDVAEAIASLQRWQEMRREESK